MTMYRKVPAAVAVVLACIGGGLFYLRQSSAPVTSFTDVSLPDVLVRQDDPTTTTSVTTTSKGVISAPTTTAAKAAVKLMYLSRADDAYGKVVLAEGSPPVPKVQSLSCERVAFSAGRGLCLASSGGAVPTYSGIIFDRNFARLAEFGVGGLPSRARVSPDGRWGAATVFVTGHSYLGEGSFSTATKVIDLKANYQTDLELYATFKDGEPFSPVDRNLWGVSFTPDSKTFYATLKSGAKTYLVKGDPVKQRLDVVTENAECPSVSPDGKTITFKEPEGDRYRLVAFDPATGLRRPLPGAGFLDDQMEWLDNHTIVFGVENSSIRAARSADIYQFDIATPDAPRQLLVPNAESPIVVR